MFIEGLLLALLIAPAPPEDPVIRDVLGIVSRAHVEPGRVAARPMLLGALDAAREARGDISVTESGAAVRVAIGGLETELLVDDAAPLADGLGPALERLLDVLAPQDGPGGEARDRNAWRARLLNGALKSLDRWSGASTGRKRADQQVRRTGKLAGVGARIGRREGVIRVLGVVKGSGAEEAGLRAGDAIVEVDCTPVAGLDVNRVLSLLRGAPGTRAVIVVARGEAREAVTASAMRRELPQPSVRRSLRADGVGVLRIDSFSRRTAEEARRAHGALSAGGNLRGLIIDLRGNTGGSMLGAAGVADLFIDRGVLTEALDARDQPVPGLRSRVEATPGGDLTTPVIVLVDKRTASSSELLAASLAWNGRARLAGERTFGKVVVGKPHVFDGCDLTVTITSALMRAAGRRLPQEGLEPEIAIDPRDPAVIDRLAGMLLSPK